MMADPDEDFNALIEGLDLQEPDDVVDVSKLSDIELSNVFHDARERLKAMGEMLSDLENTFATKAGSDEARELHSLRLACLLELRKRGM